ncbi:hypothetical protein [Streptomyces sp. H51]|uniref:hypothetical protein n=1 Tax=Streptomyces sp. H51 TaxID=3111770 RepID=UPI002D783223|nr:hypothetical protein [Streptomyces sp. H51]
MPRLSSWDPGELTPALEKREPLEPMMRRGEVAVAGRAGRTGCGTGDGSAR